MTTTGDEVTTPRRYTFGIARSRRMVLIALLLAADPQPMFIAEVKNHFAAWDADRNGTLSLDEVNHQVVNPKVKGPEAAAIAALRRSMRSTTAKFETATCDELNLKAAKPDATLNSYFAAAEKKLRTMSRELFPKGKPTLTCMNQGKLGDCFCLAPMGAMVHRDPDEVTARIRKIGDNYHVRLGKETLVVSPPTDAELALSSGTEDDGLWLNVYEKAVGAYRMNLTPEKDRPITALDLLTKGGSAGTMVGVLTGNEIERFSLKFAKKSETTPAEVEAQLKLLRPKLVKAFAEKRLVTTGTTTTDKRPPNVLGNHAYAILGYDEAKDLITVWNPHGQKFTPKGLSGLDNGYVTVDGRFDVPLTEFAKTFAGLAFEVRN